MTSVQGMQGKDGSQLTRITSLNALVLLGNYFCTIIAMFIANPLLIRFLGVSQFGVWQICLRLLSFVSAADGRATQALKWTVAHKSHSLDIEPKQRDVGSALLVWLGFVPIMLSFGGVVVWTSPYLIHDLSLKDHVVRLACAVLLLDMILLPLRSIPQVVMAGMNRAYQSAWIDGIRIVLYVCLIVLSAYKGFGLIALAGSAVAASVIAGLLSLAVAKRSLPWFRAKWPHRDELRSFTRFSIWIFLWALNNKLMLCSDIVILGMLSSPSVVASYAMCNCVAQTVVNMAALTVSAGIPGMGSLIGAKEQKRAARVREEIIAVCWLAATVSGCAILLWNSAFISLWIGRDHYIGYFENFMIVLMMTQLIFIRSDAFIIDITLNVRGKVVLGGISSAVGIVLGFLLGWAMSSSVVGVATGLIIGRLILTVGYPMIARKSLGEDRWHEFWPVLRMGLVTGVSFVLCGALGRVVEAGSWGTLVMLGFGSVLMLVPAILRLGLAPASRAIIGRRLAYVPQMSRVQPMFKWMGVSPRSEIR